MCRETGPSPSLCSLGAGGDSAGGGWGEGPLGEHIAGEGLVSVGDGASQTGRVSCYSCVGDLGWPPVDQGVGERSFETGWDGSGIRWANSRRKVVASWLQRPPTSMASTTSLQLRDWRSSGYVRSGYVAILAQAILAQVSVLSVAFFAAPLGKMPLSQLQLETLKNPATIIQIQPDNPKKPGSKAFERFDRYKAATTIGDATNKGANWQDLTTDFEKEFLKIPDLIPSDVDGQGGTKRGAPAGTPDREADARSKMHSSATMVPKVLIPEANDPISKVGMSAATITYNYRIACHDAWGDQERDAWNGGSLQ